jgi:N6-adenosine-specific RNA methylase IME4
VAETTPINTWLKECEVCNAGLCVRVDNLKADGKSERAACRIMSEECEGLYSSSEIRKRYRYHKIGTKSSKNQYPLVNINKPHKTLAVFNLQELIDEGKKFSTIYADPAWKYSNQATRSSTDGEYDTLSVGEIAALPIKDLVSDKAHLHLWTTNAFLFEAPKIIEAWGFEYKSCFLWVKPKIGIGNYWRVSHEFLLLVVRGGVRFADKSQISWLHTPSKGHSQKPEKVAKIIEKVSPGPYLELFARRTRENWTVWGDQIDRTLFNEGAFADEVDSRL